MRYNPMPRTDLSPSILALGTVGFGTAVDPPIAFDFLDTFFEHGGNFIDTAHVYGAWVPGGMGRSRRLIEQWLKERHTREQVIGTLDRRRAGCLSHAGQVQVEAFLPWLLGKMSSMQPGITR